MSTVSILNDKYCSVDEAAEIIGCTDGRVRQLLRAGELKGVKINARAWVVETKDASRVADIEHKSGRPRSNS